MTAQRRVVAEVLTGDHVHLTAEEVHGRAQALLPEISVATVYNALNEMVAMGEVLLVSAGEGPKRYDPNAATAHQHLVCVRCGTLRDVTPRGQDDLRLPNDQRHGFRMLGVDVYFRGLCPACRRAELEPAHA